MLGKLFWIMTNIYNKSNFKIHGIKFGKQIKTYGIIRLKIDDDSEFKINDGVIIRSHWKSNPAGGGQKDCIFAVRGKGSLEIGKNVGISNSTIYCNRKIVIEDDVYIGVNSIIYDTDFHSIYADKRLNGNTDIKSMPVIIKRGAWIGGHCIILKGVSIGEQSVIGAGSVVTKDVPPDEVWAGNPARFIKKINQ